MNLNKQNLKNKIIYRASYRGTKEMDILMIGFVRSILDKLNLDQLKVLSDFVNIDDETLLSFKNKETVINFNDEIKGKEKYFYDNAYIDFDPHLNEEFHRNFFAKPIISKLEEYINN